jgi:hypothetical protein
MKTCLFAAIFAVLLAGCASPRSGAGQARNNCVVVIIIPVTIPSSDQEDASSPDERTHSTYISGKPIQKSGLRQPRSSGIRVLKQNPDDSPDPLPSRPL